MTRTLAVLPVLIALALILMGYHFDALELKFIGGLYLGYGSLVHIRNVNICRQMWTKQRTII